MPSDTVRLGNYVWRLAKAKNGTVQYGQAPAEFFSPQVAQTDMSEANAPPEVRIPISLRDLSGGGGQSEVPQNGPNTRYHHIGDAEGEGVDATLSPDGPTLPAAELNIQTLPTQTPTDNLLGVLWKGGAQLAYFAMGRRVYSWTGAAFAYVSDMGAVGPPTDRIVAFRGVQTADYWYVPKGSGQSLVYSADSGATWFTVGVGAGLSGAISMVVLDGEVVVAKQSATLTGDAMICSFDDGGALPTIYGVIDPVGDPAFAISRLVVFANRIVVIKDGEGVFLLANDRRTLEQEVFPELRGATIYHSGITVWRGLLWLPTNRGLYAVTPGFTMQPIGPEQDEAGGEVGGRGLITALAGDAHHLYAFRYVSASEPSILYKAVVETGGGGVQKVAWHPFLRSSVGAQCRSMQVLSPGNGTTSNGPRLLCDLETAAGAFTVYWLKLPSRGRDPRADPAYRYAAAGTLYHSRLQGRFPAIQKGWYGVTPFTAPLDLEQDAATPTTALTVRSRWKLGSAPLEAVSPYGYTEGAAQTAGEGLRDSFFLRGRTLAVAVRLQTTDPEVAPQLRATTVDFDLEPEALWSHRFVLDLTEGAVSLGGAGATVAPAPQSPAAALAYLRTLPATGPVPFSDPWDNVYDVTVPLRGVQVQGAGDGQAGLAGDLAYTVVVIAHEQRPRPSGTYDAVASGNSYDALAVRYATYTVLAAQ